MPSSHPIATTDMQVTSIRLERELKERLKELAGHQGYQTLIREVLWTYVQQRSGEYTTQLAATAITTSVAAVAHQVQHCVMTGEVIQPQDPMRLGLTHEGVWVPLSVNALG